MSTARVGSPVTTNDDEPGTAAVRADGDADPGVESAAEHGYYGQPIVKPHVWKDAIGWYFFSGGLSGAASVLAAVAEAFGRDRLAVHARRAAAAGLLPSPALLVYDLGRPARFINMLRLFKPTSPMNVGSWLLTAHSALGTGALALAELGRAGGLRRSLTLASGATGALMATYTAVLLGDTATPMWAESRREMPLLFASGAAASAGAATALLSMTGGERPSTEAHRLAVVGMAGELAASEVMRRRLGTIDARRTDPPSRRFHRAARLLTATGAALSLVGRRHRSLAALGFGAAMAGSLADRLAIVRAGAASASDPAAVIRTQSGS